MGHVLFKFLRSVLFSLNYRHKIKVDRLLDTGFMSTIYELLEKLSRQIKARCLPAFSEKNSIN